MNPSKSDPLVKRASSARRRLLSLAVLTLALTAGLTALAEEAVNICFNYGCKKQVLVTLTDDDIQTVREHMAQPASASVERARLGQAMALFYKDAARTTPIWRDKGRNHPWDPAVDGVMDCIDHTHNTTQFLLLMQRQELLVHHKVATPLHRWRYFDDHHASQIVERDSEARFAVDSWFFDFGQPALVQPVAQWLDWKDPISR